MRCVVTGGAGFIGSHVAERLAAEGHRVLVVDDLSGGFAGNVPAGADFEVRSVLDPLDGLFASYRPDAVYHLAAYAAEGLSHHIPVFNFTNNTTGTVNVLAAAYRAGASHFVYASSVAVYGHPRAATDGEEEPFDETSPCAPCDPYGAAKLAGEHYVRCFREYYGGPSYTIFRPHNVFGPRQNISDPYRNVVGIFMARALRGEPLPVFGDGTQARNFSYIETVARCIAEAPARAAARDATFNVGGGEAMSVGTLARHVARVMGVAPRLEFLPPRKEVHRALCRHERARAAFPEAHRDEVDIVGGLKLMAAYVRSRPVPPPTECPAPLEITEQLPPSWESRLSRATGAGTLKATAEGRPPRARRNVVA